MANIKSAKKRIAVNEKKQAQNQMVKSKIKTDIKKFKAAVTAGELTLADEMLKVVFSELDMAASNNIMHRNKAARNKANLSKQLHEAKQTKKK